MPAPPSALSPIEAWQGRSFRIVVTGRKHRNGGLFSESYPCQITEIDPSQPVGFADLVQHALAIVKEGTDIPADLLVGFGIYFTEDPA